MVEIKYGRRFLLDMMPKHSICAEIGVDQGLFSQEILDVIQPKKLHLIDPWDDPPHDTHYDGVCEKFREQVASGPVVKMPHRLWV